MRNPYPLTGRSASQPAMAPIRSGKHGPVQAWRSPGKCEASRKRQSWCFSSCSARRTVIDYPPPLAARPQKELLSWFLARGLAQLLLGFTAQMLTWRRRQPPACGRDLTLSISLRRSRLWLFPKSHCHVPTTTFRVQQRSGNSLQPARSGRVGEASDSKELPSLHAGRAFGK
jgi:hypothetical protein